MNAYLHRWWGRIYEAHAVTYQLNITAPGDLLFATPSLTFMGTAGTETSWWRTESSLLAAC